MSEACGTAYVISVKVEKAKEIAALVEDVATEAAVAAVADTSQTQAR